MVMHDLDTNFTASFWRDFEEQRPAGEEGCLSLAQHMRIRGAIHPDARAGMSRPLYRVRRTSSEPPVRGVPRLIPPAPAAPVEGERPTGY